MTDNKDTGNKEVDLLVLITNVFNTITGWIISFLKSILSFVLFLIRKWLPLGISVIIGVGVSYTLKKTLPPVYTSELTSRSNTIPTADMISYINRLHGFCQTENINALSQSLSIPAENAAKIVDIEAFWVIDLNKDGSPDYVDYKGKHNVYDTMNIRMSDRFVVRIRFSSLDLLEPLKSGLDTYIRGNTLFSQQNRTRLKQYDELIFRYTYDIKQLDSLQKIKYYEETKGMVPGKSGQMVFLQEQKTQLVYEDIYKLYEQKQILEMQKEINPGIISILSDFAVPVRPFTGTVYYGKYIVPVFFVLTILILIFFNNRNRIRELFRKY